LFTALDQPGIGSYLAPGLPMSVDGAHTAAAAAPVLGEHTATVLAGRLGMSSGEIVALVEQGVVAP
jgi:2-methylfumaryl-CoA isomerase